MALVPSTIPAVQGSCVVIPCTYNYPRPCFKKIINSWLGFWKKGNKVVATSIQKWKLLWSTKNKLNFWENWKHGIARCYWIVSGALMLDLLNDQVYATCSIFHSCPSIPPQFSWSHTGVIKSQSKKVNAWNWQTVSTLTFPPLATDFNKPLNCTVWHRGGKEAQSSIIFLIWAQCMIEV